MARLRIGKYGRLNVYCQQCGLDGEVGEVGARAEQTTPLSFEDFLNIARIRHAEPEAKR